MFCLIFFLNSELSDIISAIISFAPSIASSAVLISFSGSMYFLAIFLTLSLTSCARIIWASGSNPLSRAIVALVLFLLLNGLYKSSSSTNVLAFKMLFFKSSSSFPSSSILFMIFSFLSSRFLRYFSLSSNFLKVSSFSEPVTSFLYLAMKGMVLPSSINLITFSTCQLAKFNSF